MLSQRDAISSKYGWLQAQLESLRRQQQWEHFPEPLEALLEPLETQLGVLDRSEASAVDWVRVNDAWEMLFEIEQALDHWTHLPEAAIETPVAEPWHLTTQQWHLQGDSRGCLSELGDKTHRVNYLMSPMQWRLAEATQTIDPSCVQALLASSLDLSGVELRTSWSIEADIVSLRWSLSNGSEAPSKKTWTCLWPLRLKDAHANREGEIATLDRLVLSDPRLRTQCIWEMDPACRVIYWPQESIHAGRRHYDGLHVVFAWPLELEPGQKQEGEICFKREAICDRSIAV